MIRQIKNILVPVDFSSNTALALSKALEFCVAGHGQICIHLFHVQKIASGGLPHYMSAMFSGYAQHQINSDYRVIAQRLQDLAEEINQKSTDIRVEFEISFGDTVQKSICKKATKESVDLIIIGKQSHHSLLTFLNTVIPSKIAANTGIPVLTAKPGSFLQEIKTVVIPVGPQLPETKLDMLAAFRTKSTPQIKLVIFNEPGQEFVKSKQLLLATFQMVKNQFLNIVNYEILDGNNKASALLKYCNKIGADVLIVYAGSETRVDGWTNRHISDMFPAKSKTQVLAISPA